MQTLQSVDVPLWRSVYRLHDFKSAGLIPNSIVVLLRDNNA